jgi:hypothetical protein
LDLFKHDKTLWIKNEAFGNKFEYIGNNTFEEASNPEPWYWTLQFEFLPSGSIQSRKALSIWINRKKVFVYLKEK